MASLSQIERSAKSLLNIINSILEISKIEIGKVELTLSDFNLEDLVEEVTVQIEPQILAKGNHLEVEIVRFID